MLLHELGHVEADQRVFAAKEELCQRLGELGLAHARGAEEDERATRSTRVLQRAAAAANGAAHGADRLVLANDALVKGILATQQLGRLRLGEVRDGHTRHVRHHVGDVLLAHDDDTLRQALAPLGLELLATSRDFLLLVT